MNVAVASSPVTTPTKHRTSILRVLLWSLLAVVVIVAALLRWGALLLISSDPLPVHPDAAIVLQGSVAGELARLHGAMQLLERSETARVVLSVPRESYWGEAVAPAARRYVEKNYGSNFAARIDFCETSPGVNSTEEEADALVPCFRDHGWQNLIIVTSDYHTRRAGIIWRKVLRKEDPSVRISIHGVTDPEFSDERWWGNRLSAKTWYLEITKLVWTWIFG